MTSPLLVFTVRGTPVPQGSKTAMPNRRPGGRPLLVDDNAKVLKPWRKAVREAAERAVEYRQSGPIAADDVLPPYRGPLTVDVVFTMPKPVGAPKTRRTYPAVRPDGDKLLRAVLDALTDAEVYVDDGQVCRAVAVKAYPGEHPRALMQPGIHVVVAAYPLPSGVDVDDTYPAPRPKGALL